VTAKWGAPIGEDDRAGRSVAEPAQPGRFVLRLAGLLTQLASAGCLLLGTIAFVLIQQNKSGGSTYVIAWGASAMIALVFGGLMVRGGLISLLIAAILDISFGSVLLVIDKGALTGMLRVLSGDDVAMVADVLFVAALSLIGIGVLCFLAIPQAIRYARWLHAGESGQLAAAESSAASTNPGFPPPPIPATKSSMWMVPTAPIAERRSRRRLYFALGGFAIGFGAGIGVLLSSTTRRSAADPVEVVTPTPATPPTTRPTNPDTPTTKPGPAVVTEPGTGSGSSAGVGAGTGSGKAPDAPSATGFATVQAMLQEQRSAIARGDVAAVTATLAPEAIGFGIDADELVLDKAAVAAQLARDLGAIEGGTVEIKFEHLGQEGNHAWVAQELELSAPGKPTRKLVVTMLAARGTAGWQVAAWHWAVPVRDEVAEKLAILGTKPAAKPIPNKTFADKDLDQAVRDAFGSRKGFADARSDRDDGFNFGSGPQERIVGGARVKQIFGKLRAEIKLHDNAAYVVGLSPTVGVALVNADFTHKTRAATELTQTFRVLAVLLKEGGAWKLVLTQWSHGGPIRG